MDRGRQASTDRRVRHFHLQQISGINVPFYYGPKLLGMAVFMLVAAAGVGFLTGVPKTVLVMVGFSFFITSFATGVGGTGC
jgi:hypothetical protein